MVRTAIELKYIEDVPRRRVCFSKRKRGLKKKAYELSVLCNAEVGLIVISDTGKLYEFSSSRYITFSRPFVCTYFGSFFACWHVVSSFLFIIIIIFFIYLLTFIFLSLKLVVNVSTPIHGV